MIGALLRWMGYSTWFLVALVGFLYLSIPTNQVKKYAAYQASKSLKKKVTIDGLEIRGISGLTLKGVTVELPVPTAGEQGTAAGAPAADATPGSVDEEAADDAPAAILNPPGLVNASEITLDVNTWGLLTGKKLRAALNAEISGGSISDVVFEALDNKRWNLEVGDITGVDLGPMRLLRSLFKMDMDLLTRLSGKMHIEYAGKFTESKAEIELQLMDTVIPYLPIKHPREPFPIGEAFQVAIGDVDLSIKLDKTENLPGMNTRGRVAGPGTTLLIEELKARGEHVDIQLDSGQKHTVTFRGPKTSDGVVDVKLVVHFTDAFFEWKGDGVRADGHEAKDVSHSALKPAMDSFLRSARITIGGKHYYGFHCQGTVKSFKCPPRRPSRRISPMAPTTPPAAQSANQPNTPTTGGFERPSVPTTKASARPTPRPSTRTTRPTPTRPTRTTRTPTPRPTTTSRSPASRLVEPAADRERARDQARRGLRPQPVEPEFVDEGEPVDEPLPEEEPRQEEPLDEEPRGEEEPLPDDEYIDEEEPLEDELDEPGAEEFDEEQGEFDDFEE